jgi:membrane-bound serine protease (ClpP class)
MGKKGVDSMESFINPQVAYLLLVSGTLLVIMAIFSPGTGLLELGALFLLVLAGWQAYNLPINWWALAILAVGVVPFIIAVRQSKKLVYLVVAILSVVIGSSFLFRGENWWQPAVNPVLAIVVSILAGAYLWVASTKVLEADRTEPAHDPDRMIGQVGEAKTDIYDEGSVQVGGELWSAQSESPIPSGTHVRVVSREGLVLSVEKVA